jgi:FkbM family methyltransferase
MSTNKILAEGFNHLGRCRHGYMLYNVHDVYIGRSLDLYGEFSEGETDLFRQLIRPGDLVLDVGANLGAHTIFFARTVGRGGRVHAFEPQRMTFQTLCGNVALNSLTNVWCHHAAVADAPGDILVPELDSEAANNFGGLGLGRHNGGDRVPVLTLDSLNLPQCRLIKIDVEGMELPVLKGAQETIRRFKPVLYVENDRKQHSDALLGFIDGLGYEMYWHLPPLFGKRNYYRNETNVFANIVSVNVLCVHPEAKIHVTGFRRVRPGERHIFAR